MGRHSLVIAGIIVAVAGLPAGAGESRAPDLKRARASDARKVSDRWAAEYAVGGVYIDAVYRWSRRWMEAELALCSGQAERLAVVEAHLGRMKAVQQITLERTARGQAGIDSYLGSENYRAEAEFRTAEAKLGPLAKPVGEDWLLRCLAAARVIYSDWDGQPYQDGRLRNVYHAMYWSRRWLEAEQALSKDRTQSASAARAYLDRAERAQKVLQEAVTQDKAEPMSLHRAAFFRAEARLRILDGEGRPESEGEKSRTVKEMVSAAKSLYESLSIETDDIEKIFEWSNNWRIAQARASSDKVGRIEAAEGHVGRMRKLQDSAKKLWQESRVSAWYKWAAGFYSADAELLFLEAKAK